MGQSGFSMSNRLAMADGVVEFQPTYCISLLRRMPVSGRPGITTEESDEGNDRSKIHEVSRFPEKQGG